LGHNFIKRFCCLCVWMVCDKALAGLATEQKLRF